ncbi:hypothetical protein QZK00_12395 [Acinetobacter baumannii]|nr:hypothetical protein [Acinetobacter baumannii]
MKFDQYFLIFLASFAFYFAVRFFYKWFTGRFNNSAINEWMNRGFSFGLGLMASFVVIAVIVHLLRGFNL